MGFLVDEETECTDLDLHFIQDTGVTWRIRLKATFPRLDPAEDKV